MFNPNLDLGNKWVAVQSYTVAPNRFSHQHEFDLNIRADALIINLSSTAIKDTWKIGGDFFQNWLFENEIYQVAEAKIRLKSKHIIPIEPLAQSTFIFIPVGWLYNWKIEIWAREYRQKSDDLISILLSNQELIIQKIDNLEISAVAKAIETKRRVFIAS